MILREPYYHGIIRRTVVAFAQLFTGLSIVRTDNDKNKVQKIKVPIAYGPKEKWLRRLEENPDGRKNISAELPRLSFELTSYQYDASRKVGSNPNFFKSPSTGKVVGTPVPYNLQLQLYVIARTQDDSLQIIEQILPYFAPGLTVQMESIEDPLITSEVSFSLQNVSIQDSWDGDFNTQRFVTHVLTFDAKIYLYGPIQTSKIIKRVIANVSNTPAMDSTLTNYNAELNPFTTELPTDNFSIDEYWSV